MALRDAFLSVSPPPLSLMGVGGGDPTLDLIFDLASGLESFINAQQINATDMSLINATTPNFDET